MRKVLEVEGDDGGTIMSTYQKKKKIIMSIYHSSEMHTEKRLRWQVLYVF